MKALISVSDKTGIVEFAAGLVSYGVEIISTGGTYQLLKSSGIPATPIDEVTGFPEMLDGRVKTLHPLIHGGLLALRDNPAHRTTCTEFGIGLIDIVVVNLYPFEATIANPDVTLAHAIENIDIGGPSMIRSASKNYQSVTVVVNPDRYADVLASIKENHGNTAAALRAQLALEAFTHTGQYDVMIANFLAKTLHSSTGLPAQLNPLLIKSSDLRYGENPHQAAAFYHVKGGNGLSNFTQHHGKELSYNNIMDMDAAWQLVQEFAQPGAVIIKHTNPCGCAIGESIYDAYTAAYESDPVSAFGSIIGLNRIVDAKTAEQIAKTFVELVIAPGFEVDAMDILQKKSAIRLITQDPDERDPSTLSYRHVPGGFLVQQIDDCVLGNDTNVVTQVGITPNQLTDLEFAFSVVKHVKSNAIVVAKNGVVLGVGAGQMSRIDSVKIALEKAGADAVGAVLASDAFFPFRDSIDLAAKAGIVAVVQPGGSKRDSESVDACNAHGVAMMLTGVRHFKH